MRRASLTGDSEALRAFWAVFHARAGERRCAYRTRYSRWRAVGAGELFVSQYVTRRSVGVFLRGPVGEGWRATAARLEPVRDWISAAVEAGLGEGFLFPTRVAADTYDERRWGEMADWLHREADRYVGVLGASPPFVTLGLVPRAHVSKRRVAGPKVHWVATVGSRDKPEDDGGGRVRGRAQVLQSDEALA